MSELPNKELLRPDEVALFMSVSVQTVYNWADQQIVESVKIGGILRIKRASIAQKISGD